MITRIKYKKNEFVGEVKVEKMTCCDGCDVGYTDECTHCCSYIVSLSDIVRVKKSRRERVQYVCKYGKKKEVFNSDQDQGH